MRDLDNNGHIPDSVDIPFRPLTQRRLGVALDAIDALSEAPLRLAGHYAEPGREVFELHEEFEDGSGGRTMRVSVNRRRCEVVDIELSPA